MSALPKAVYAPPPVGMRDCIMPEAQRHRDRVQQLITHFNARGYDFVITPLFEPASLFESMHTGHKGMQTRELLRFVDPESGEVVVLRPDITPQITRLISSHLRNRPKPWRLCYEGEVIRRQRHRARRQRQVNQVGFECIGIDDHKEDLQAIMTVVQGCTHLGLDDYCIDIGHVGVANTLLENIRDEAIHQACTAALSNKDRHALEHALRNSALPQSQRDELCALTQLHGDTRILDEARQCLAPQHHSALDELQHVVDTLEQHHLSQRLYIDLAELRGQRYYTGISFALLAPGPGQPIGTGGRYQTSITTNESLPAVGFAFDMHHLEWALRTADQSRPL